MELRYIGHVILKALNDDPEVIIYDHYPFKDDDSVIETVIIYSNSVIMQLWTVIRDEYTIQYQK